MPSSDSLVGLRWMAVDEEVMARIHAGTATKILSMALRVLDRRWKWVKLSLMLLSRISVKSESAAAS